ncbi:MAG: hypothetical protein AAF605_09005 [Myxococcota bacterium]
MTADESNSEVLEAIDTLYENGVDNLTMVAWLLEYDGFTDDEAREFIRAAGYTGEVEHINDRTFRVSMVKTH